MNVKKNEVGTLLPMVVTKDVVVNVLPYEQYEYLMTILEVAKGYGTSKSSIFQAIRNHLDELIKGKHFVRGVDILLTPFVRGVVQPHSILLTKRGIVRLGFFIKSERAKLFRDWAEKLIIRIEEQGNPHGIVPVRKLSTPRKTRANRLTQERLVSILADVCCIEDQMLRLRITKKLLGEEVHYDARF